jgi:two-component system, response regulator YesN
MMNKNGTFLSLSAWRKLERLYRARFGLRVLLLGPDGRAETPHPVLGAPGMAHASRHAIEESVRWGEASVFYLAPGVISWVAPLVRDGRVCGGVAGGEVTAEEDPVDPSESARVLAAAGVPRSAAEAWLRTLPAWPQARIREAAAFLFESVYAAAGRLPDLLRQNRDNALQQRQIAEAIHQAKAETRHPWPFEQERRLLALIRAGDANNARKHLNNLLAAMFLDSPRHPVLQARCVELLGYLVRSAIEDSPMLEPLIHDHHRWIEGLIRAPDFEGVCVAVRDALDAFMSRVATQGYNRTSLHVRQVLDYLARHYAGSVSLNAAARAAGLSRFRTAHLLKETTGQTLIQHVKRLRIDEACRLLETTTRTYADIAGSLGFADQSHFIRHFKDLTGSTPGQYRRERKFKP